MGVCGPFVTEDILSMIVTQGADILPLGETDTPFDVIDLHPAILAGRN